MIISQNKLILILKVILKISIQNSPLYENIEPRDSLFFQGTGKTDMTLIVTI
jgi:hypothetical protein